MGDGVRCPDAACDARGVRHRGCRAVVGAPRVLPGASHPGGRERRCPPGDPSRFGDVDFRAVLTALYETGFDGPMRPDHGRMIWGERGRPGYGLYDRALGATYLQGVWEGIAGATAQPSSRPHSARRSPG